MTNTQERQPCVKIAGRATEMVHMFSPRNRSIFIFISFWRSIFIFPFGALFPRRAEHVRGGDVAEPCSDDADAVHGAVSHVQPDGTADRRESLIILMKYNTVCNMSNLDQHIGRENYRGERNSEDWPTKAR